jgi:hypothetical protein
LLLLHEAIAMAQGGCYYILRMSTRLLQGFGDLSQNNDGNGLVIPCNARLSKEGVKEKNLTMQNC